MNQPTTRELLLATANPGKRREFMQLLPPEISVMTLDDLKITLPPEIELTFAAIADRKATFASSASGRLTLADDSGLIVDVLGGAPGIRSARYAGEPPSDANNRARLLAALTDIPPEARAARFVCAVSLAAAGEVIARAEGVCEGTIGVTERGEHGFGYDSIFVLATGETMAELSAQEKNRISHRARAYREILPAIIHSLGLVVSKGGAA